MTYNPKYDGLQIYVANISLLKTGDILLTRNRHTQSSLARRQADVIAQISGGNFSHALLCTGTPTFIEAIGDGVSNLSLQNCFSHTLEDIRLLRYRHSDVGENAGRWALTRLGQKYSVRGAIQSVLPGKSVPQEDPGIFCSALVAAAFRAVGAVEFSAVDPLKVTPATLEKFDCFDNVTNSVFHKILSPKNTEGMSALDGDRNQGPVSKQAEIHRSIYKEIAPTLKSFFQFHARSRGGPPDTFMDALSFVLIACKNACEPNAAPQFRHDAKDLDDKLHHAMLDSELRTMLQNAQKVDEVSFQRILVESFQNKPDFDLVSLKSMYTTTLEQIESRSSILGHPDYPTGVSKSWDYWIDLTEESLRFFRLRQQVCAEALKRMSSP